ncbi:hypothetical protein H8S95_15440 [Pontibacter sp. KCTC 32443]|uniref:hypothetical protein n=1 Tax=Pontibacter TaxID=323449 RepID=UPI00164D629A|nr:MULTISPECIES: hypothetical protein [Pontibacter]MBC5775470.1 hypothetical protein [Pontibacter sp. KCTC 32443]
MLSGRSSVRLRYSPPKGNYNLVAFIISPCFYRSKNAFAANNDFQQDEEIISSFKSVFAALQKFISDGQLQKVKQSLNQEIQELLEV